MILSQRVAEGTQWGAEIARNPWVYVVRSRGDIEQAVDEINSEPAARLLQEFGLAG